jgi:hypothetical protein
MENLIAIYIGIILFNAICLWIGMIIRGVDGTFLNVIIIAAVSPFIAGIIPIPYARWLALPIAQLIMLSYMTDAEIWPDGFIIVGISSVIGTLGGMALLAMLFGRGMSLA